MLSTQAVSTVTDFFLQASRDSTNDYPLTQPQWDFMNEDMLKYWRIALFGFVTTLGGKSLKEWGIAGFPWFISDWAVFTAIGT